MKEISHARSISEYAEYVSETHALRAFKTEILKHLLNGTDQEGTLPGFSSTAGHMVDFLIDPNLRLADGKINLRETVNCPETWFNTRMRAAIQAVTHHENNRHEDAYIMEQKTPLYKFLKGIFPHLIGSEFLGDDIPLGQSDRTGLRNEDATRLTFPEESFDLVMSFEVLEHIPDYIDALKEVRRVLRPGGRFYFTAPFVTGRNEHIIRAKITDGKVVHILEPEWHGDPIKNEGILCFQHFGWSLIDELSDCGFCNVEALLFDQIEYGYYTLDPILVFRALA
ncbi:class I SAM-dependent methyltransferase [Solirhodobacter olei]|uniref:class I SAM-dependent methyltransferase n=1 Tax=Solirhodobacter olei TaxID=2493082 RepID=UPI000FDA4AD2|nr:class I SAM-dependent methyltransferase [Solirhodobacter olei]